MPHTVRSFAPDRQSATARHLAAGLLAAAALLCLAAPARASDGQAPAAAKSAAKTAAAEPGRPAAAGPVDPMDTLREKLATRLGAIKVPEAPTPYVVRVVSKASAEPAPGSGAALAERKRQARLQAEAALQGIALHRLADGRWLACRWNLSRELADTEIEAWLQRVGGGK